MKALIVTEGSPSKGMGHIARCSALASALHDQGVSVDWCIDSKNRVQLQPHTGKAYYLDWNEHPNRLRDVLVGKDIVVVDSYNAKSSIYEMVAAMVRVPVFFDDYQRLVYPPQSVILNAGLNALKMPYSGAIRRKALLGPQYTMLRKPFWQAKKIRVNKIIKNVLVTFGGADATGTTLKAIRIIRDSCSQWHITAVIGLYFKDPHRFKQLVSNTCRLYFSPSAIKMKWLMERTDIAITASGQTLYELASIGVPTIASSVADNQRSSLIQWRSAGIILSAGNILSKWWPVHMLKAIDAIKSQAQRQAMHNAGLRLINPHGASAIAKHLKDLCLHKAMP
jgi:UDP-2,4-diacetamido-2,4,6-trideoxy-beta-L-altropyranose hydrolase